MTSHTYSDQATQLARRYGVLTAQEARRHGIHTQVLTRMVREGTLERVSRGCYRLPEAPVTEHHGLALASAAVPDGVVCLVSALSFHGIGTQIPHELWMAVERRARKPDLAWPPLRVFRFGGKSFTEGVETHEPEGVPVRVYEVAKTLADIFKYRNKVGIDVALEALKEAWVHRRFQMDRLTHFARICRVEKVMAPYIDAVVA